MPTKHPTTTPTHHHPVHKRRPVATIGVGIAICLALIALLITRTAKAPKEIPPTPMGAQFPQVAAPDTSSWVVYTDTRYPLSFKHPNNWVATSQAAGNDYYITLKPQNNGKEKITVYISSQGYLGFDGLKEEPATIDGKEGVKIDNSLAGLQHKGLYYTFDAGLNSTTEPTFQELLKTVMLH